MFYEKFVVYWLIKTWVIIIIQDVSNYGLKVMYVDDLQLMIIHSSVLTILRCDGEILCEVNHRKILRDFHHDLMIDRKSVV